MLITDEYKILQVDLHARYDYGIGMNAEECNVIVRTLAKTGATVLDYGCGQRHLGRMLRPDYEVEEYDPCIPGYDGDPARADIVVCADVLEHVEPELLDNVIMHLRALTRKYLVLVIPTGPSYKIMADGRQAHLTVEGNGFWFQKLTPMFNFERFDDRSHEGCGLLIVATPRDFKTETLLPIARVRTSMAVADDIRNENVRKNCARMETRINLEIMPHDRTAHLACYGPSLAKTWTQLALARAMGHEIFTVSGAHKFLIDHGVIPFAHMDCDPRPHKADMIGEPHHDVQYWLASCVDPSYLDKLKGHTVGLWHSYNGAASRVAFQIDPGHRMVVGGGSIGLRALSVLYCRGFRKYEIHGMDCSYEDGQRHAGPHGGKLAESVKVKCMDRWFDSNGVMITYARYFVKQMKMMPDVVIKFHGDGLLQNMMKESG